jgi:hypothetical protein
LSRIGHRPCRAPARRRMASAKRIAAATGA